ncbi:MAG: hypothetical protein A3K10_13080 [Bacteroidetes bacterium RIFCSPLOWO2_12_FULL_31_6]|nr:MAG: hypothetical protein A3K10_13080 [Bacteroidetes bacterium RIFCSPLOWO2_12_FULL_31_6]
MLLVVKCVVKFINCNHYKIVTITNLDIKMIFPTFLIIIFFDVEIEILARKMKYFLYLSKNLEKLVE